MDISRYFHTVRYLRPVQVYGRLNFRLRKPRPDLSPRPRLRAISGQWSPPVRRVQTQLSPARFRFLNIERQISAADDWNNPDWDKLWLYNLHYFDDLNAVGAPARSAWHKGLIRRWIVENPPGVGNGWEPYPLSLRIVNWVKWALAGNVLDDEALHSLAVQARYLSRRIEYHLLGNHLLTNGKALLFAGLFFEGPESDRWLAAGLQILSSQLREQVLPDGGHFERSPMYHNIILGDVLDLVNFAQAVRGAEDAKLPLKEWHECAAKMLQCSWQLAQPDGEIALVNDAAVGIAPTVTALESYARRLGVQVSHADQALTHLDHLGYVCAHAGDAWALLDVGPIGPDYLPGHAHADTLSFELSVGSQRVIVDSGTSTYAPTAERLRQRATAAHNTVEIDGVSSSEVWGSFRVARRAYPFDLELTHSGDIIRVRCAHDGYTRLKGRPVHRREWLMREGAMLVKDAVEGAFTSAVARFHFHPECVVEGWDDRTGTLSIGAARTLRWVVEQGRGQVVGTTYHPEFGMSLPAKCLEVALDGAGARTRFEWAMAR